jgi:hypothetical protein
MPTLIASDFWMLTKDFMVINDTLPTYGALQLLLPA